MSVPTIEVMQAAIRTWVIAGSGIPSARVYWVGQAGAAGQGAPQTVTPYITLDLGTETTGGMDAVDVEDAADVQAGAEIEHVVRGSNVTTLTITLFGGAATGTSRAQAILRGIKTRRSYPLTEVALTDAGVGVGTFGPVRSIGASINVVVFEPRAVMEVQINYASEGREAGTYIQRVGFTNETVGEEFEVPTTTSTTGTAAGTSTADGVSD